MTLPDLTVLAVMLLGVTIPVFIFTVAFLGSAIERAKQEEKRAKDKQDQDFQLKINHLENKVKALKESGDSSQLESQLKEIKKMRRLHNKQIKTIKGKYAALEFHHSILLPGVGFLLAMLFSHTSGLNSLNVYLRISFWLAALGSITFGVFKIARSLLLAQEISSTSEELQSKRMTDAYKAALVAFKKETEEQLAVVFRNISFPLTCKPLTEITIDFRVVLTQGKIAHTVELWFFVPDGFELLSPPESDSWKQGDDFVVPNIRTIKRGLETIRRGIKGSSSVKFKTPSVAGTYFILYKITSDEYLGDRKQLELVVEP